MTTTTTTNYGWTIPNDSELVKDGAAAIRTLGNAADASLKTVSDAAIKATIVDAKGDLIAATAADTVSRVAVGTDGQVLTADAASAAGVKWATASSGGMTLISETVASNLSTLSLSSIPSTYKSLLLQWHGIYHTASSTQFSVRFNNDSAGNYYTIGYYGDAGGLISGKQNGTSSLLLTTDYPLFGFRADNSTSVPSMAAQGYLKIDNYSSTTKTKEIQAATGFHDNAAGSNKVTGLNATYNSTSAISSIDIVRILGSGNFSNMANTSIRLYGLS